MTKGLIVTVTSEADTTQQYTLRAKLEENRTVAQLKGLILQEPRPAPTTRATSLTTRLCSTKSPT